MAHPEDFEITQKILKSENIHIIPTQEMWSCKPLSYL
jgi:hypothetical protein